MSSLRRFENLSILQVGQMNFNNCRVLARYSRTRSVFLLEEKMKRLGIQRKTFYNEIKCEIERSIVLPQMCATLRIE
jgi:hypothetical protein